MVIITLHNFRSYPDRVFEFDHNKVILIKGESGSGKTTILQSIFWCLYGHQKKVSSFSNKTGKCYVQLDFDDMTIYRQKNPERLLITTNNITLEDDEAESFITKEYGSKDLFNSCSLIEQKNICSFFNLQNHQRLEFLNTLSFNNDKPEEYKAKVDGISKEINNKHKVNSMLLERMYEDIQLMLSQREPKAFLNEDSRSLFINELETLKHNINELTIKATNEIKQRAIIAELEKQLNDTQNKLSLLPIEHYDEDALSNQLQLMDNSRRLKEKKDLLQKKFNNLSKIYTKINSKSNKFTNDEIINNTLLEKRISESIRVCKQLKINYDDSIDTFKKSLDDQLVSVEKKDSIDKSNTVIENKKKKLENDISTLNNTLKITSQKLMILIKDLSKCTFDDTEIERLKEIIKIDRVYSCPKCECKLQIQNGLLEEVLNEIKESKETSKKQLDILLKNKSNYSQLTNNKIKLENEIESLKTSITNKQEQVNELQNDIQETINVNSKYTLSEMKNIIKSLYNIEFLILPLISSNQMQDHNNYLDNEEQKRILLEQINEINYDFDSKEYDKVKTKLSLMRTNNERRRQLNETINRLNKRLLEEDATDYYENKLRVTNDRINELINVIDDDDYSLMYNKKCDEYDNLYEMNDELLKDYTSLNKLSKNISLVQCLQLENVIESINIQLNENLSVLFDEEIHITLELIKQQKNKNVKSGLFVKIFYKESEYDSINQLSGGEQDRVSFALSLAFNMMYQGSNRMILLDEPFSAIGTDLRERCVALLKNIENCLVLVISHEEVEGYYNLTYNL
jgi:DNA repair exonuclease SbcCD ATPase subunit